MKNNLNWVAVVLCLYFVPGCFLSVSHLNTEGNTYECEAPEQPHGYITYGGGLPGYIDKSKCKSRLSQGWVWSGAITLLFIGPLLVLAQALG